MKQLFSAILLAFLLTGISLAQGDSMTLRTGIQWDTQTARTLALKHLEEEIDVSRFQGNDPFYAENLQNNTVDANTRIANRQVTHYSDGDYSVTYDGEYVVNYYAGNGNLRKISVCSAPFGPQTDYAIYPRKCVEYGYPYGKVLAVSLDVSPQESFVFLPTGELKNHWVGSHGFDANNLEQLRRQ